MFTTHRNVLLAGFLAGITLLGSHASGARAAGDRSTVSFNRHIVPLFSRLGCNLGSCHGAVNGQGGFRLSLFGGNPEADHVALLRELSGRRIDRLNPEASLLLHKPTGRIPHQGGKRLAIDDDAFATTRAALRIENTFTTARGGSVRPWLALGVQNTTGEKEDALDIALPATSGDAQAFPAHDIGTSATLDVGVEARLGEGISLFGVGSYGHSVSGSDKKQRAVNLGVRIRW